MTDIDLDTNSDSWPYESDSDKALFDALARFADLFGWELSRRDPLEQYARAAGLLSNDERMGTLS